MGEELKEQIYNSIKKLDPEESIVVIDFKGGKIRYNEDIITLHQKIEKLTFEELVRAYIIVKLIVELKYTEKKCIEVEKRFSIGRPTKKGAKGDILVNENGQPFMFIETKSPTHYEPEMDISIKEQLFKVASVLDVEHNTLKYLIYFTVTADGEIIEKTVTIDYKKYRTYEQWEDEGKTNLISIPENYGIVIKPVFVKGTKSDLRTNVTKDELERIRGNIHDILWSGGKYHIELFFNLMGILLAKIYDEKETEEDKPYQFQVFYKNNDPEEPEEIFKRVNALYMTALKEYFGYSDDEIKRVRDIVFDPPKVKYTVEILQEISFTNAEHDILGEFFEKIVRNEFKQSKAQYLTHFNIVHFIIRVLEIEKLSIELINNEKRLPYIIDPSCGSGTFLIEAMKLITSYVIDNKDSLKKSASVQEFIEMMFPLLRKNAWAERFIYGIENNTDLSTSAKVNMVGHGDGSANIESKDALLGFDNYTKDLLQVKKDSSVYLKPINEQFDVVISNPPFSITIDRDTAKNLPKSFLWGDEIKEKLEKSKKKKEINTEHLFIERWYQLLRPYGRLGVVLPESVFDVTTNRHIRLFLYKYFWIKAVVSLPDLAFQPYTPTKTSLLFAQKKTPREVEEWEKAWNYYKNKYSELKSRIDELFKIKKADPKYENLFRELISKISELLNEKIDKNDYKLNLNQLKKKYSEEIKLADDEWWIFLNVSKKFDYGFSLAIAKEIGYKRGLRGEYSRPNQLFETDETGNIIIDTNHPKTILDSFRGEIKWKI